MNNFYKRTINISDFKPMSGVTEGIVLDNKINFLIYLTQNIEDIGIYQDDFKLKIPNIGDIIGDIDFNI